MPVRKTESRLPDGFTGAALGQSAAAAGNTVVLVSFFSSPCALRQTQVYVVFVTDAVVASKVATYDWTFTNGTATPQHTDAGLAEFTPQNLGPLSVSVKLKDGGGVALATINLSQTVVALNNELEVLIDQQDANFPKGAHPDTSRELLNEVRGYINVLLPNAADELYNKMLSSLAYARCMESLQFRRHLLMERHAAVINSGNHKDFLSVAKSGFGICKTRPQLLAMFLKRPGAAQPFIDLVELPDAKGKRAAAEKAIVKAFNDATKVTEAHKIDLFNLLRFPKSHLAMVKLVVDGLQTKYFSSATVPQLLKEAKKAEPLLTQFEIGPIEMGSSFKATADSGQIFKLLAQKIWTIKVAPIAGAPGGGGAPSQPGPVGTPEDAPIITFVAETSPNENGFLAQAKAYHKTFGLSPDVAKSFEGMLRTLATPPLDPIARLRILSHFSLDPKAITAQVFIPLFDNQFYTDGTHYFHTESWHFEYGTSDEAGLVAHFQNEKFIFLKPGFLSAAFTEPESAAAGARKVALHAVLFNVLKKRADPSLTPFKFTASGPAGAALKLVQWAGDLFALGLTDVRAVGLNPAVTEASVIPAVLAAHKAFVQSQIDALKTPTGVMSAANVDPLVAAITGLTIANLPVPGGRTTLGSWTHKVAGRFLQSHTQLRTDLTAVRARLKNAFIDIRGCRIGQDKAYMQAMRKFFGVVGQEPTVSGPTWFQAFTIMGRIGMPSEAIIDAQLSSGEASEKIAAADVQRSYSDWSGMIGLSAQLSFWAQLFSGNKIGFLARTWIPKLPPIGMDAVQVTGLGALSYANLLARLRDIFFIPAATGPTATEANAFNTSSMANVTALNTEIDAVDALAANATQPALQARLTALQAVATATSQTLPAAPNPLTLDFLKACIDQLSVPLVAASKIDPLLTALKAKADHTKFGFRYMMGVGLPLVVQSAQKEVKVFIYYLQPLRADALKSLAGIHWKKPVPAFVATAIAGLNPTGNGTDTNGVPTDDTARASQLSLLTNSDALSEVTVNPEDEFASLIVRVP